MEGADKIIPNAVKRNIALIKAKQDGGMATKKDLETLEKYKTLYPSMFNQHVHVHQVQRAALVLSRRSAWCDRITVLDRYIGS